MTRTAARRAVTLVEVLIAIFLMGIGLMAILSLFPLGAAQMAQAIKDQRCAEAATNADALARITWKITCDDDAGGGPSKFAGSDNKPLSHQRFMAAMDDPSYNAADPNYGIGSPDWTLGQPVPDYTSNTPGVTDPNYGTAVTAMPVIPAAGTGPSYPVLVDPIGWVSNAAVSVNGQPARQHKWWLPTVTLNTAGGARTWRIPRRSLTVRTSATNWSDVTALPNPVERVFKQFSLMDDLNFTLNGKPKLLNGNPNTDAVERQGRYSWAYMYRRRNNSDRTNADISVIVYSGRSIDVASPETAYAAQAQFPTVNFGETPTTKSLVVGYSGAKPAIRRGQWILDATLCDAGGNVDPQGLFYRVVNVDDGTAGQLGLELQTPIVGKAQLSGTIQTQGRVIVVMNNVVEVFTRNGVTPVTPPQPY